MKEFKEKLEELIAYASDKNICIVTGYSEDEGVAVLSAGRATEKAEISAMLHGYHKKEAEDRLIELFKYGNSKK